MVAMFKLLASGVRPHVGRLRFVVLRAVGAAAKETSMRSRCRAVVFSDRPNLWLERHVVICEPRSPKRVIIPISIVPASSE
jgi:superfamily II helicase